MGFTLSSLQAKGAVTLAYEFEDGDQFTFDVAPNKLSFVLLSDLQTALADFDNEDTELANAAQHRGIGILSTVLLRWDLVDEKGKEVPISAETLLAAPLDLTLGILELVMDTISPNEGSATS